MGVMKAAVMGMLPDLSSRAVVMEGFVKLAEVQNDGLDKIVALQYRHTWERVRIASICSTESVRRNPVLFVRLPGWWT